MPSTYTLISTTTLSTSAASVTFSSIPQTFTDLIVRYAGRLDGGSGGGVGVIKLNGATLSMSSTYLRTNYSVVLTSGRDSAATSSTLGYINDGGSTSNTFTNSEVYIPNYTISGVTKQYSFVNGMEYFVSAFNEANYGASLITGTGAITSLEIDSVTGGTNFVANSSFYLYGIKNS